MTQSNFYSLLENDRLFKEIQLEEIDKLIELYPYTSNLYVFKSIAMHEQQNEGFALALEKAATRTISRKKLHELIEGKPCLDFELEDVSEADSIIVESAHEIQNGEDSINEGVEIDNKSIDSSVEKEENNNPSIEAIQTLTSENEVTNEPIAENEPSKSSPKKNDFSFSFIKVTGSQSGQKSLPLIPAEVYNINSISGSKKLKGKKKEDYIIDRFLESSPSISPPTIDFGQSKIVMDLAANSGKLSEEIITENMAMIYLKQKNFSKALDTYRKLKLKNPEKSDYFAALIKNLENKIV